MRRPGFAALCAACALALGIFGSLTLAAEREPGPPVVRNISDVALSVDAETLHRQYTVLSSMPSVKVAYSALGPVRSVEGATGVVLSPRARNFKNGEDASEVLEKFKDVLLAAGNETLRVSGIQMSATGRHRYVTTDQFINGIPVLYGGVSLRFEEGSGLVDSLGASFLPDRGLPRQPKISEADAAKRVEQLLVERGIAKPGSVKTSKPSLAYTGTHPDSTRGHLVWAVPASFTPAGGGATDGMFWIDAVDGEYVGSDALSKNALQAYTATRAHRATSSLALIAATCGFRAHATDAGIPASSTCAVTDPKDAFYGNDSLGAVLPANGTFVFKPGGPGFVDADGALGIKVGWDFRRRGTLLIRGRRLDGVAPPARAYIPRTYDDYVGGMSLALVFPTPGCWEITGTLAGASLTFVVAVQKIGDGPASRRRGTTSDRRVSSEGT